jgi:hypothetical protein
MAYLIQFRDFVEQYKGKAESGMLVNGHRKYCENIKSTLNSSVNFEDRQ